MADPTRPDNPAPDAAGTDDPPADLARLVDAARRGEGDAWATLVSLYARRIYALARSRGMTPSDAEEITQSVFATVSIKVQSGAYDERGAFEPWLFQITANRVRDALRASRRKAVALDALGDSADAPGRTLRAGDGADPPDTAPLRRAVLALAEADREVIELRHRAGMSFKDIAATLGQPIGTVLARHHRALGKLRHALGNDTHSPPTDQHR